jgi:hypothetical protein
MVHQLDNNINSLEGGKEKESIFLLNALTSVKRNENKTMDGFNSRFDKSVHDIPHNLQPTLATILLYYLNAYQGQFNVFLNQSKPINLREAQAMAKNLDVD